MFYYLVQDLKALIFSLISLHFKVGLTGCGWLLGTYKHTDDDICTDQAHLNEYKNTTTMIIGSVKNCGKLSILFFNDTGRLLRIVSEINGVHLL